MVDRWPGIKTAICSFPPAIVQVRFRQMAMPPSMNDLRKNITVSMPNVLQQTPMISREKYFEYIRSLTERIQYLKAIFFRKELRRLSLKFLRWDAVIHIGSR